ncbi:MAG: glycosyltransferase [Planctomycetota bacterium]
MSSELISVVVPSYRRPALLAEALASVFGQDYRPLEVLVMDDSPDETVEQAVEALEPPAGVTVRYFRNRPSLGQAGNVNRGFATASGQRLVLLHDDDALLPGAITTLAEAYDAETGVVIAYGQQRVLQPDGTDAGDELAKRCGRMFARTPDRAGRQADSASAALLRQLPNNGYLVDTVAARSVGYLPPEDVGHACDMDFGIRLALRNPGNTFLFVPRYTSAVRVTPGSVSRGGEAGSRFTYERVAALDLPLEAEKARRHALRVAAPMALREYLHHGRPGEARRVWTGRAYGWWNRLRPRGWFHIAACFVPGLHGLASPLVERTRPWRRRVRLKTRQAIGLEVAE